MRIQGIAKLVNVWALRLRQLRAPTTLRHNCLVVAWDVLHYERVRSPLLGSFDARKIATEVDLRTSAALVEYYDGQFREKRVTAEDEEQEVAERLHVLSDFALSPFWMH